MAPSRSLRLRASNRQAVSTSPRTTNQAHAASSKWTAPSILVASTLVINAFDGCQAAPRPVATSDDYQQRAQQKQRTRGAYSDVDDVVPTWLEEQKRIYEAEVDNRHYSPAISRRENTAATPTRHAYSVATGTGKNIVVPSAFASTIASSWDPRHRSVWFQRKAVIITSVFLAILIVLVIGAAAFVRDKREAEAEGEVDVSDEAALKRMKEERDMRNGRKSGKRKKVEKEGDDASIKSGSKVVTTGIAMRWTKVPVRRLRKRQGRTSSTRNDTSTESVVEDENRTSSQFDSANVASMSQSEEISSSSAQAVQDDGEMRAVESTQGSVDAQSSPSTAVSGRNPLSVADLSAAEAELERHFQTDSHDTELDAFPPAYISRNRDEVHPSANRQLAAGSSRIADMGSTSEEKGPARSVEDASLDEEQQSGGSLPSIAEGTALVSGQEHYSGHVATDDKTMLGQLQYAASAPAPSAPAGGANELVGSNDSSIQPASQASAPILILDEDVTEEELEVIHGAEKGKSSSTLLPAPPRPLSSSSFSPFDMPYIVENPSLRAASPRTANKSSSYEKEQEAEEERRKTIAFMESKPEDMTHLPKYESAQNNAKVAPSAPFEEDVYQQSGDYTPPAAISAPSAPPAAE